MFAETQRRALQWDYTLLYGMLVSEKRESNLCLNWSLWWNFYHVREIINILLTIWLIYSSCEYAYENVHNEQFVFFLLQNSVPNSLGIGLFL